MNKGDGKTVLAIDPQAENDVSSISEMAEALDAALKETRTVGYDRTYPMWAFVNRDLLVAEFAKRADA